ncbi:MAG: hypothetical protein ONB44_18665 [candidate division KSB1 bacterium]|nr:hypothetical protein [candidate division KSB1 bacterium]MDZ7310626.1 hypothetical protein [candidate division KSB1 bacterium]
MNETQISFIATKQDWEAKNEDAIMPEQNFLSDGFTMTEPCPERSEWIDPLPEEWEVQRSDSGIKRHPRAEPEAW